LKIGVALSSALTVGVPLFVEIGRHSLRVFKSNLNDTRDLRGAVVYTEPGWTCLLVCRKETRRSNSSDDNTRFGLIKSAKV
jgi:hypothetical protein